MSGYRTFYDFRKNYDLKSTLSKDDKSKSSVSDKSDSLSKYTSGSSNASNYRPYVSSYTSSSANKDKSSDKLGYRSSSKEPEKASTLIREKYASSSAKEPEKASTLIREKYATGSTKEPEKASTLIREKYATGSSTRESTTPSYRLSRKDEPPPPTALTRHLSRSGLSRSRDPSPVDRGSNLTSSSYTPYRSAYASNVAFAISKLTRRNSKEDLSTSAPSKSSSYTSATNSLGRTSRRNSKEDLTNITNPSTLSRRNSKEDIFNSVSSSPRYGSSSLRTYSSLPRTEKSTTSHTSSIYSPPPSISTTGTRILTRAKINTTPTLKSSKDNLLTVLKTPSSEKIDSRPVSRQSSHNEEVARKSNDNIPKIDLSKSKSEECITVTVVTRGTSPTPPSSSSYLRSKRSDMARVLQKDIKRPRERPEMVDKEMQSDRMDDTARYSRFGSSTKVATMPWSTYLDLKYTSPTSSSGFTSASRYARTGSGYSGYSSAADSSESLKSRAKTPEIDNTKSKESSPPSTTSSKTSAGVPRLSESPSKSLTEKSVSLTDKSTSLTDKSTSLADKSISSTDKSASLTKTDSSSKVNEKVKITKKITSASKSKSNSTAEASKLLPPSSPKSTSLKPSSSTSSLNSANKDFRKSVLNMSPNNSTKNIKQLKHSTSSGDSDTSVNAKPAGKVLQKTNSSSKIVRSPRTSKSPSVESTTSTSGATSSDADDDILASKSSQLSNRSSNNLKSSKSQASIKAPSEELTLPTGKVKKSPTGSKISSQKSQSEKSEPVSSSQATEAPSLKTESVSVKKTESDSENSKYKIRPIESGERAWWLDENSSKKQTNSSQVTNTSSINNSNKPENSEKEKPKFKIRPVQSGERAWWLDENSSNKDETKSSKSKEEPSKSNKFLNLPKLNINHIGSGDRDMWLKNFGNEKESKNSSVSESKKSSKIEKSGSKLKLNLLKRVESGEKPWWMMSKSHIPDGVECLDSGESDSDDVDDVQEPLGDRLSPDGIEATKNEENCTGRLSPYDNVPSTEIKLQTPKHSKMFISKHTNIDDILGSSQPYSPLIDCILAHGFTAKKVDGNESSSTSSSLKLDDSVLQLYKDGDYSSYLDMEASINEQPEEFEGFQSNRKNSIVLRTQLSVRVHNIIEKLLNSEGRELRRALFSLKQIFQEDKDLVHEFVQNDGLSCLIKVGSEADQNYQNYILRALGQVMLYVDGMNGVMEHNQTVQWLYTLIASRFRLVVKTALKLLLVFVEYVESNCLLLIKAIHSVDNANGVSPWNIIMRLLKDYDAADTELLIYATTLINKCLNGIPDQDTYYDQVDCLEEQGIEGIIQRYMSRQGTDLDLLRQFQIYEAVLEHEDGENKESPLRQLDETIRKTLRNRKSLADSNERRKSRRHSTGTSSVAGKMNNYSKIEEKMHNEEDESSSSQSSQGLSGDKQINGRYNKNNEATGAGVTPALRRRRERAERQRSFMREQETVATFRASLAPSPEENGHPNSISDLQQKISNGSFILKQSSSRKDIVNGSNKLETLENGEKQEQNGNSSILKKPWVLSMMYSKSQDENGPQSPEVEISGDENSENIKNKLQLKKESSVKDLTQKLASQNILHSPVEEMKNRIGDMSGLINKAKEGLAKSKSKVDVLKSPTGENIPKLINDVKKSENELHWEELIRTMDRPLNLCDLDFTDMNSDDEINVLAPAIVSSVGPPPPPPIAGGMIPPPFGGGIAPPPPPSSNRFALPPITPPAFPSAPVFGAKPLRNELINSSKSAIPVPKKNKKTVKLFWKEVRGDPIALMKLRNDGGGGGMIWDELNPVSIDTQKLEHLFESRAKDLLTKKQQELNKNKEIIVLDHKRSNAINIGMTKLPPPRSIKTAILKMDATVMNREGIEKLLTMLPTEEERTRIQDAQATNPDLPLGSAEQFLLTLASISELPARLKLWAFKLDFESSEREIAEPLMDLKQGMELLKANKTFRAILSTLLSIGIFLNGSEVKGFQIEYLAKVPEVKDTVHKHSLLHHLCYMVMEKFPDATDLYSEIGAVTRVSKVDFDELNLNIQRLETDCKASWDHLKLIAKHDGTTMMKVKMSDFLADCAERIILLSIIHRRVKNRFHKFLLWLGVPMHRISDTKPSEFCRVISEFALEYRTTRERVLQQLEKKANHRERNKTRGKMITEVGKFRTKEDRADAELRHLLGNDVSDVESLQGTLPWRRKKSDATKPSTLGLPNGDLTDADDEILESLVKTATKAPTSRTMPRERKRTRNVDRKSMRRTLKNGLSEEEKKHIAAYIKGY